MPIFTGILIDWLFNVICHFGMINTNIAELFLRHMLSFF